MKYINWLPGPKPDYGPHSHVGTPLPMLVAFLIIGPLGVLFNAMIIIGVVTNRKQWKPYNVYVLNVCIADFLISAVYLPYNAYAGMSKEPPTGCLVLGAMYNFLATVSVLMLAALALSRYRLIKLTPDRYRVEFSPRRTLVSLVAIYLISLTFLLVIASGTVMSGFNYILGVCVTTSHWADMKLFEILQVTVLGIPCYGIIVFSYANIYFVARQKSISFSSGKMPRSIRLSRNLFIVTAVYTVCWLPGMLLSFIDSKHTGDHIIHQVATMLNLLHCMLNPAVYLALNRPLRDALFKRCRTKPSDSSTDSNSNSSERSSQDAEKPFQFKVIKPKWLLKLMEKSRWMLEWVILKKRTKSLTEYAYENKQGNKLVNEQGNKHENKLENGQRNKQENKHENNPKNDQITSENKQENELENEQGNKQGNRQETKQEDNPKNNQITSETKQENEQENEQENKQKNKQRNKQEDNLENKQEDNPENQHENTPETKQEYKQDKEHVNRKRNKRNKQKNGLEKQKNKQEEIKSKAAQLDTNDDNKDNNKDKDTRKARVAPQSVTISIEDTPHEVDEEKDKEKDQEQKKKEYQGPEEDITKDRSTNAQPNDHSNDQSDEAIRSGNEENRFDTASLDTSDTLPRLRRRMTLDASDITRDKAIDMDADTPAAIHRRHSTRDITHPQFDITRAKPLSKSKSFTD